MRTSKSCGPAGGGPAAPACPGYRGGTGRREPGLGTASGWAAGAATRSKPGMNLNMVSSSHLHTTAAPLHSLR